MKKTVRIVSVALLLMLMVTAFACGKKEEPAPEAPAEPSEDIKLLTEIRDLLKK